MTFDATFWVAIAFVAFVALVGKKIYVFITESVDKRAESIRHELDEAVRLREEAQALLASYERKQRDAAEEAGAIIDHAKVEAARIVEQAEEEIAASIERRTRLAEAKIAQAEAQALDEVRNLTVDVAVGAAQRLISENMDEARAQALVDEAVAELRHKLH